MNLKKRKIICVCDVMKTEIDIVNGMMTVSEALKSLKDQDITIKPLQEYLNISSE